MLYQYAILAAALMAYGTYLDPDDLTNLAMAVTGVSFMLFVQSLVRYWRRIVVGKAAEREVQNALEELGGAALRHVRVPGPRGWIDLEHVALFPGSLAIIETRAYGGRLLLREDEWLEMNPRGQFVLIDNPIWRVEDIRRDLAGLFPGLRVWGLVVVASRFEVADGHTVKDVVSLAGLRSHLSEHRNRYGDWRYSEQISAAWARLTDLTEEHTGPEERYMWITRRRYDDAVEVLLSLAPICLWGGISTATGIILLMNWHGIV